MSPTGTEWSAESAVPVVSIDSPAGAALAIAALRRGQLIAYPTDTLYGIGGDALSAGVAALVIAAKGREADKGFPVLLPDQSWVRRLARAWPPAAATLAHAFWPGSLTMVLPARPDVPETTRRGGTVALRVPGLASLRALIASAGVPLIGTSANRSGQLPATTAAGAAAAVGRAVALVLDGGTVQGRPSTVVAVTEAGARILREGAISREAICQLLGSALVD